MVQTEQTFRIYLVRPG